MTSKEKDGRKPALALIGPTAAGKTELALLLAETLGTEIIGVDSRQIYRRLDVGTAKPTAAQRRRVRHHLVDFVEPDEPFSVGRYRREVDKLLPGFEKGDSIPFFVGGTGLYLKAVLEGLCPAPAANPDLRRWLGKAAAFPAGGLHSLLRRIDPKAAERIHPNDSYRLTRAMEVYYLTGETMSERQERHQFSDRPFHALTVCLNLKAKELKTRIAARLGAMLDEGFPEEVKALLDSGYDPSLTSLRAVGYPQMIAHVRGEAGLDETLESIRKSTWQYVRRQLTWFRKVEGIRWLDAGGGRSVESLAEEILALLPLRGA